MKYPIEFRELFYDTLSDGTLVFLDWCLVNTPMGAMLEPRPMLSLNPDSVQPLSMFDQSFNRISPFDEDAFFATFNGGGRLLPVNYVNT